MLLVAASQPLFERSQVRAFGVEPLPLEVHRLTEIFELGVDRRQIF